MRVLCPPIFFVMEADRTKGIEMLREIQRQHLVLVLMINLSATLSRFQLLPSTKRG